MNSSIHNRSEGEPMRDGGCNVVIYFLSLLGYCWVMLMILTSVKVFLFIFLGSEIILDRLCRVRMHHVMKDIC